MRLTQYSDFALRVLIYVGLKPTGLATMPEIADSYGISRNHLTKVVQQLAKLGYLATVRGRGGGLRLARDPSTINVGEVVRATEREFVLVECFDPLSNCCIIAPNCVLRVALSEALEAFLSVLDRYTLADLLGPGESLSRLLAIPTGEARRAMAPPPGGGL